MPPPSTQKNNAAHRHMIARKPPKTRSVLLVLSLLFVCLFYSAYWIEGWLGVILLSLTGLAGLLLSMTILSAAYQLVVKRTTCLTVPIVVSLVALFIVWFRPIERVIENLKSPVILYGHCEHTVTGLSLKLRADGTFEYNAGAFLRREMYFGEYTLESDTISLHFEAPIPTHLKSTLVFTPNGVIETGDTTAHRHSFITPINKVDRQ